MTIPRALTIAGSDSGGGAGIQADLKTFQELGVFGMSALTAITAQNTQTVTGIYELSEEAVARQIDAVAEDIGIDAVKTGMIASTSIMEVIADKIRQHRLSPLVIDPVMISKSGAALLDKPARQALKQTLLPLATLITPNLHEAEVIVNRSLSTSQERMDAAKQILDMGASAVVIKGGHTEDEEAVDLFYDGEEFHTFSAPRYHTPHTHGTGCTFSAALAASLAKGESMYKAVETAKQFITKAISHSLNIGKGHGPTNHWAYNRYSKD